MLIISILVLRDIGYPFIICQTRLGKSNKEFKMFKFRTLPGPIAYEHRTAEIDTSRASDLGNFLRIYCLDELPQFFNVLLGQMSLVGPRPMLEDYYIHHGYSKRLRNIILSIKPGITGEAQIYLQKNDYNTNPQKIANQDINYIKNINFFQDMKILIKTIYVVWHGR